MVQENVDDPNEVERLSEEGLMDMTKIFIDAPIRHITVKIYPERYYTVGKGIIKAITADKTAWMLHGKKIYYLWIEDPQNKNQYRAWKEIIDLPVFVEYDNDETFNNNGKSKH